MRQAKINEALAELAKRASFLVVSDSDHITGVDSLDITSLKVMYPQTSSFVTLTAAATPLGGGLYSPSGLTSALQIEGTAFFQLSASAGLHDPVDYGMNMTAPPALEATHDEMKGAGFLSIDHSLKAISDKVEASAPEENPSDGQIVTTGTVVSGSFADTYTDNEVYFQLAPVGGEIDVVLTAKLGANRLPSSTQFVGRLNGIGGAPRFVSVQAWNRDLAAYRDISSVATRLEPTTTDENFTYQMNESDAFANGDLQIRYYGTGLSAADRLYIDRSMVISVQSAEGTLTVSSIVDGIQSSQPADYAGDPLSHGGIITTASYRGVIYLDENAPARDPVPGNGKENTPFNNLADARIVADLQGLSHFFILGDSNFTLDQAYRDFHFSANTSAASITLNNQDVSFTVFESLTILGIQSTNTGGPAFGPITLKGCRVGDMTALVDDSHCTLAGTLSLITGDNYIVDASSAKAGGGRPGIAFPPGQPCRLSMRKYSGGIEYFLADGPTTDPAEGGSAYHVTSLDLVAGSPFFAADCTGGFFKIRGVGEPVVDLSGGGGGGAVGLDTDGYINDETFSTFDAAADLVDLGNVAGTPVSGPDDLKADLTTLESRLTETRADNLDNLDATVSSRSTFDDNFILDNNGLGQSWTWKEGLRLIFSFIVGERGGGGTTDKTYKVPGGSKIRVTLHTDADGNSIAPTDLDSSDA